MQRSERLNLLRQKYKSGRLLKKQFVKRFNRYKRQINKTHSKKEINILKAKIKRMRNKYILSYKKRKIEIENLMDIQTIKEIKDSEFFKNCERINNFLNEQSLYWKTEIELMGIDKKKFLKYRGQWMDQLRWIYLIEASINKKTIGLSSDEVSRKFLFDSYIKSCIKRHTGIERHFISDEMIDLKRDQLKLYRKLKQMKGEIRNGIIRTRNKRTPANDKAI